MRNLLILVGVAFVVVAGSCAWIVARYMPGLPLTALVIDASLLQLWTLILMAPTAIIGVVTAFGSSRTAAFTTAGLTAALGFASALLGETSTQMAIRSTGISRFDITAPARAESLSHLALGLLGALIILGLVALRSNRDSSR